MRKLAFLGVLLCLAATASADDSSPATELSAAQIVANNVAARGGLAAWRKIESMVWVGHIESADSLAPSMAFILEQKRPNKSRFELKSMSQNTVRVYDGLQGWKLHPAKNGKVEVQPYTSDEVRVARETSGIDGPLIDYEVKGTAVSVDGVDEVGGRKTYRLNVRPPFGANRHLWIDAETFLDVKSDHVSRNAAGVSAQVSVYYRDYKNVEDVRVPTVIETGIGSAQPTSRMVIEKISLNATLDDRIFGKPGAPSGKRKSIAIESAVPQALPDAPRPKN